MKDGRAKGKRSCFPDSGAPFQRAEWRAWPWNKVPFLNFSNRGPNIPQTTQWLDVIMTDKLYGFRARLSTLFQLSYDGIC